MPFLKGLEFRRASPEDAFRILKLYQISESWTNEPSLIHIEVLREQIVSQSYLWLVAVRRDGECLLALSLLTDKEQLLAKIHRILIHPEWAGSHDVLRESLPILVGYLSEKGVEVVYCTSRTMSQEHLALTVELGFQPLGIFPKAIGEDPLRVGGMTAYYFKGVLHEKRYPPPRIHEKVHPFFSFTKEDCRLAPVEKATDVRLNHSSNEVPELEMISAPRFARTRFQMLKARGVISSMFYPFHHPNAVVSDPEQKIEVFLTLLPEYKYAAILGERLERPVHSVLLYRKIAELLESQQITFLEVISDAADPITIEVLLQAHFIPCAYLPAFRKLGDSRRDYVVFSRSSEGLLRKIPSDKPLHARFRDYLGEFQKLDEMPLN